MNISLQPELARFVEDKVRAGQFADASDVVNGALQVLKDQEALSAEDVDELRRQLAIGVEQLDRGDSAEWDVEAIKTKGRRLLQQRNSEG